jgi:hypothetical protein
MICAIRKGEAPAIMTRTIAAWAFAALLLAGALAPGVAVAQELVPRAYWPAPAGTNVLSLAYQYSTGDVVTDPSLPIAGVDSRIHAFQAAYQRTFGLFGRTANLQFSVPYSSANMEGFYLGQPARRDMAGLADARARLSVNLRGAPVLTPQDFRALSENPETLVGVSLLVQAPTGEYDVDRLINLGTNRWSVKPALGVIYPFNRDWMLEFELGAWFFSDNDEFVGLTRKQDPIVSTEAHLIKRFGNDVWGSLDANFYAGGRTQVGPDRKADLQRNSRFGATVFWPFRRHHALRASYSTGVVTESGGDYEVFSLGYLYVW